MAAPSAPTIASVRRTGPNEFIILHNVPATSVKFKYYMDPFTGFSKANAMARTAERVEDNKGNRVLFREAAPHRTVQIAATAINVGDEESALSTEVTANMEDRQV